jgi:RHS repeat-associated protein
LSRSENFPTGENVSASSHIPPVLTKTWFHLGTFLKGRGITRQYEAEYYREGDASRGESGLSDAQFAAMLLPDTVLPDNLTVEETPEACRALKGSILRQETYALDGTDAEDRPYSVSERSYSIQLLQARHGGRHAVFFVHPREQIDFNYERRLFPVVDGKIATNSKASHCSAEWRADPRLTHAFTMDVDAYGNVLLAAVVGYGRRFDDPATALTPVDRQNQKQIHATFTVNGYTNAVLEESAYRGPLPCESRTFELLNVQPVACLPAITNLFRFEELRTRIRQAGDGRHDLPYEDHDGHGVEGSAPYRRLIEHLRTLYRRNDFSDILPLGQTCSLALPGESFKLAFTPGLVSQVFRRNGEHLLPNRVAVLGVEGGYRLGDDLVASSLFPDGPEDHWWIPSGRVFFSPTREDAPASELEFARGHFFLPHRYEDPFGNNSFIAYDRNDLLLRETRDALDNTVLADSDYRVLQPRLIRDPNRNRSEVVFDTLGLVVGSAVMGKEEENKGDSLAGFNADLKQSELDAFFADPKDQAARVLASATTRTIYNLHRYSRTAVGTDPQPVFVAALAREMHVSDLKPNEKSKIQVSVTYSDGFGREIQKKIQAEPGDVEIEHSDGVTVIVNTKPNIRWVASGWTIYNNKGKPVRQYEPFFSVDHQFQFGRRVGVSPILLYDPLTRVVGTLHPNHTYEKVVFDPWQQTTWDVNDTVTVLDPRQDPDLGAFFTRLPESEFLPTWYVRRKEGAMGEREKDAAIKAAAHARTPTMAHSDTLGRQFLSVAHNRFARSGNRIDEHYATRTELDIENNQRVVSDALDRVVMRYDYDMLGNRVHQASMEAGERWMLNDVTGKPIRAWDSRGHTFRTEYDALRRPVRAFVLGAGKVQPHREILHQRTVYGEAQGDARNHRGRAFRAFDTAGVVTSVEFDFKGNLLLGTRQLVSDYKQTPDWAGDPALEQEVFSSRTVFDALNRAVALTTPDGSISRPVFNEANLLERLSVNLRGAESATPFVTNIDYNAKRQRVLIQYGMLEAHGHSKVRTDYSYDPETFRLARLLTTRSGDTRLQDLNYSYDPVGNITSIRDDAQQTIYFNGQVVEPHNAYVYDAIYRLVAAEGREHIGQVDQPAPPTWDDKWQVNLPHPNDGQAMRRYQEQYAYDPAGNFLRMIHVAANGNWTRSYEYHEASLIEPQKVSNRLSATAIGRDDEPYQHDAHGNMVRMPHLGLAARPRGENLDWDFADRLQSVDLPGGGKALYVYDGGGQRVRKVWEKTPGLTEERIYLGGFEIFRRRKTLAGEEKAMLERETLHVMEDTGRLALVETRTLDVAGDDRAPKRLIRYQFGNHLGSTSLELDEQAQIISYEEYAPYGCSTYQAVRSQTETAKRYRYSGKERDEESGFYFHGARYYAPWLGRWTSPDPEGMVDGANLFVYGRNNPLTFTDPTGTQCDPTMQSCIDPTEPTAREEASQQSLPENERYLPPPGDSSSSPSSPGGLPFDNQPRGPSGSAIASGGVGLTSLGLRTSFYPVNAAGEALRGPLILWTGQDALNRAREMAAAGRGYTIFDTPYFGAARAEELAMAREAMGLPEGAIITDLTPELERQALPIWERYSYELTRDAAISGVGVETANAPGTIRPGSIQANVEGPWARGLGAGMGALNFAGGAFMLASIDTKHDPGLLTAGKITSGGLSVVGGGFEIYGAITLTASATTVGVGLAAGGAVIAAPIIAYEVGRPRGWIAIDPELEARNIQRYNNGENVNVFCARCHGPGGALDPNNDWNAGGARRAAFARRVQWRYIGD